MAYRSVIWFHAQILAAGFLSATMALAADADRAVQLKEPDYRGYVQRCLPKPLEFSAKKGQLFNADHAETAAVHAYIWRWTGRPEYAATARDMVRAIAGNWSRNDDFFTLYPFLVAYSGVNDAGLADAKLRQEVRALVRKEFGPQQRGNHNQTACRIAGAALALEIFPDLPEAKEWGEYIDAGWADWYSIRDTIENASNYNRIFWERMFHVADLRGWNGQLADTTVRRVIERYRDQVTPGGFMPGFGDSPMWLRDPVWISVFERAAALYHDPTLRWAACQLQPLPDPEPGKMAARGGDFRAIGELLPLCYADGWRDAALKPAMSQTKSVLLRRRTPDDPRALDKIILAPSRQRGAPFAMVELFASRGGHSHPEFGAIQFLEVNNVPLLSGPGYNNRSPEDNNIVLMTPQGAPFPRREVLFESNVWNSAAGSLRKFWRMSRPPLPGNHAQALKEATLPSVASIDPNMQHLDSIGFRVENGGRFADTNGKLPDMSVWVDNLRLAGPGGEKMLDDFEEGASRRWSGGKKRLTSSDAREGKFSLQAWIGTGATVISRKIDFTWDSRDYNEIKFDWKLSSNRNMFSRPFVLRLTDRGRDLDYHVESRDLFPTVTAAGIKAQEGDGYAETTMSGYFTDDTTVRRQFVLTYEGVLLVRDTIFPGPSADGMAAGPIWHLATKPSQGGNWFDAAAAPDAGVDARLLVCFATGSGRDLGVQHMRLGGGFEPYTVFTRATLRVGEPVVFVSLIVPHNSESAATAMTKGLVFDMMKNRTRINFAFPNCKATVEIGDDGEWNILR